MNVIYPPQVHQQVREIEAQLKLALEGQLGGAPSPDEVKRMEELEVQRQAYIADSLQKCREALARPPTVMELP